MELKKLTKLGYAPLAFDPKQPFASNKTKDTRRCLVDDCQSTFWIDFD
jgi:hypothetical protein